MSNEEFNNTEALLDSEYDDVLTLTGIDDPLEMEELLGRIWNNPKNRRRMVNRFMRRRPAITTGRTTSRADFEKRFNLLPKETKRKLLKKEKQLVDTALYVVKEISNNKNAKMLQDDDNKKVGLSNISGGKLEKGNFFTLKAIQLIYGIAGTGEDHGSVNFGVIPDFIRNGEFELTANGSVLIPSMSCEIFNTTNRTDVRAGYFELVNPKMLETQQPIDLELDWPVNAPANAWLKLVLIGTSVAKY